MPPTAQPTTAAAAAPLPSPPDHLTESSKTLFTEFIGRFRDTARREVLITGLEARDRMNAARASIHAEGLLQKPRRGKLPRVHPAIRAEEQARIAFLRVWRWLKLDVPPQPKRMLCGSNGTMIGQTESEPVQRTIGIWFSGISGPLPLASSEESVGGSVHV